MTPLFTAAFEWLDRESVLVVLRRPGCAVAARRAVHQESKTPAHGDRLERPHPRALPAVRASAETGGQKPALIRWEWRIRSVANKAGQAGFPAREAPQPDASVFPDSWYRTAARTRREPAPLPPLARSVRSLWRCGGRCRRRRIGNKRARRPRKTAGTSVRNKELLSSQTHAPACIRCRFAASAPVRTKL